MNAILRTACGSERELDVGERLPPEYRIALRVEGMNLLADTPDPLEPVRLTARVFRQRGRHSSGLPLYVEVEERVVVPPGAPETLSTGEWADAVGRAHRTFGRGGDLAEMEADFIRRHDGGTMIVHKSGALIGAFYVAPGWENTEQAVRILSALRAFMEAE
jgi:hypothetical protein